MAIQVETRDCAALTDGDLDDMASMGGAFEIGVLSKAKDDWVLCTTARIEGKLHGVAYTPWGKHQDPLRCSAGPIRWLAECSFTLYLIHWPILNLMHGLEIGAGDNPLLFILIVAAIIALAGQVARVTEHRRGDLRRWIAARLPHGKGGAGGGAGTGAGPAGAPQAGA